MLRKAFLGLQLEGIEKKWLYPWMPSIHETAYPRLKSSVTSKDLKESYTPTSNEFALASKTTRSPGGRFCFLLLLKTFQRLGYFVLLHDVPQQIVDHVACCVGITAQLEDLQAYDESGARRRQVPVIRKYLDLKPFGGEAQELLARVVRETVLTKDDSADIINVAIEELIRNRFELPGFTKLLKEARRGRTEVNDRSFRDVADSLGDQGKLLVDQLLRVDSATGRSAWNALKEDPGRPTLTHLKELIDRLRWMKGLNFGAEALRSLPSIKVRHFAAEAKSLDAARMQRTKPAKRYSLAVALIQAQLSQALDDLGQMFIKRMRKIDRNGKEALEEYRTRQHTRTDQLIAILHGVVIATQQEGTAEEILASVNQVVDGQSERIIEDCVAHSAYVGNNHCSLMWRFFKSHRRALFAFLEEVRFASTTQDTAVEQALAFLRRHKESKRDWLDLCGEELGDLSWIPDKWWRLVTGFKNRKKVPERVDRRQFEVCLFSQIMVELQSADLCLVGSGEFADYRSQLIHWNEFDQTVNDYGDQVGLPVDPSAFVAQIRARLEAVAVKTDAGFPENDSIRIENGEPVLSRLEKRKESEEVKTLEGKIAERIKPVGILDVLADTENWINWTRFFGPASGHDARIDSATTRYLAATFCYGCNLGPSQTARSLEGFDRRQIAWVNQRHVTDEKIEMAIAAVINAYNRFNLPKHWGSGKHVSADGTKWDIYEQNLLSEYHIRYGGYGGIGYYHVSDTYVALFSHFIPCGVWEAVYILDGLLKNRSDIQPDTIHADTQGQSAPVFGLAYLLGIDLMPRIRNWKDLTLFKPSKDIDYQHIEELFDDAIDWQLIETHLPDMLRVVLSIRAGRIAPSTILRKLGTYSRKNRLYQAFRELGRVVRTAFLLRYVSDLELRRLIQAATNKSEAFNRFVKWIFFGGEGLIAENIRDRQRRLIKYNHLVANCVIFHNVNTQTRILRQLVEEEGYALDSEVLAHLSPYITEHVNRFGTYTLNLGRAMPPPDYSLRLQPELTKAE